MAAPQSKPGPRTPGEPPEDWSDTEAMLDWLAERKQHPEWPRVYNSTGDVAAAAALVSALVGGRSLPGIARAIASVINVRRRTALLESVIAQSVAQGAQLDPVALITAISADSAMRDNEADQQE
jgi:hypothetical protein